MSPRVAGDVKELRRLLARCVDIASTQSNFQPRGIQVSLLVADEHGRRRRWHYRGPSAAAAIKAAHKLMMEPAKFKGVAKPRLLAIYSQQIGEQTVTSLGELYQYAGIDVPTNDADPATTLGGQ